VVGSTWAGRSRKLSRRLKAPSTRAASTVLAHLPTVHISRDKHNIWEGPSASAVLLECCNESCSTESQRHPYFGLRLTTRQHPSTDATDTNHDRPPAPAGDLHPQRGPTCHRAPKPRYLPHILACTRTSAQIERYPAPVSDTEKLSST
jgi:hypothetical protein